MGGEIEAFKDQASGSEAICGSSEKGLVSI
jgi:hypothetical protein